MASLLVEYKFIVVDVLGDLISDPAPKGDPQLITERGCMSPTHQES